MIIKKIGRGSQMKKVSIFFPIFWSLTASWNTYRVLADLPRLRAQARWETVGDILCLICSFALAIYYWIMFVKSKEQDEQGKDGKR